MTAPYKAPWTQFPAATDRNRRTAEIQAAKDSCRLDCVIRGVKVEGLPLQVTVIELRPNRRQHHPQQQPFDPRAPKRPEPTPAGEQLGDAGDPE